MFGRKIKNKRADRRYFYKTANRTHVKNVHAHYRGGSML